METKNALKDAKLQLKKSKRKDYYKILGISKSATEDEIKKAYRSQFLMIFFRWKFDLSCYFLVIHRASTYTPS